MLPNSNDFLSQTYGINSDAIPWGWRSNLFICHRHIGDILYGRLDKPAIWHNISIHMSYGGVDKSPIGGNKYAQVYFHMEHIAIQSYDITTVYLSDTEKLIYGPHEIANTFM